MADRWRFSGGVILHRALRSVHLLATLLLASLLIVASNGFVSAQTSIRLLLDWRFEGPAALFLYGLDVGYFREEGIDLTVEPGAGSREPIQRVAQGAYEIGVGDVSSLIRFRDENPNVDLKAVMMIYDKPPFAILGRRSRGVTADVKSLSGKRFGAPAADGAFAQWPIFKTVNKLDDSGMKMENVGFPVREPMLAAGELDAIFGFAHSTFISLKSRGVPADDIVTLLMADYGVELYGNAVIVNPKFLAGKPELVAGFLRALTRSIRDVVADPASAIGSVLIRNQSARRDVEIERLKMAVDHYVATPWVKAHGLGGVDRNRWERAANQIGLAFGYKNRTRAADAFTDIYLPVAAARQLNRGN